MKFSGNGPMSKWLRFGGDLDYGYRYVSRHW